MRYIKKFEELKLPGVDIGPNNSKIVNGWVNVKIDKDLNLKVSKLSRQLDSYLNIRRIDNQGVNDLKNKLDLISNPISINNYQVKLSIVILLQYFKELILLHNPTSAGFFFESYIAGLIHTDREDWNGQHDINDNNRESYQAKFLSLSSSFKLSAGGDGASTNNIISYKGQNLIEIYILNREQILNLFEHRNSVSRKNIIDSGYIPNYEIKLDNINKIIDSLGYELKDSIEKMYDNISDLDYNVSSILTGTNKENEIVDINNLDEHFDKSTENIKIINNQLFTIKDTFKRS